MSILNGDEDHLSVVGDGKTEFLPDLLWFPEGEESFTHDDADVSEEGDEHEHSSDHAEEDSEYPYDSC